MWSIPSRNAGKAKTIIGKEGKESSCDFMGVILYKYIFHKDYDDLAI